jgi:hypothetical protein
MPGVTKEQIARAKEIPILDYVLSHEPNNVKRVGNEYRLKDHTVTMSNGKWHWQSHGVGGEKATALNYLITVRGFGFVDAVRHLAGDGIRSYDIPPKPKPPPGRKPFSLPPRNRDNTRVIAYLQSRGIDKQIILNCIGRNALYENARYHNCVFIGRDGLGKARFAAQRGTMGNYKQELSGSDKRFGFVLPPNDPNSDTVAVFEAPIDCLSHQTMCEQGFIEPFDGWRLSLGGTALTALVNFLERHSKVKNCAICTDNDKAGDSAAAKVEELPDISATRSLPPLNRNDWNESLLALQKAERMKNLVISTDKGR